MLKLHFTPNTRAVRIMWLLEELEVPYELNHMPFTQEGLKSPEHRARHPLGRIPVLEDGDMVLWESGAITEYILERVKNGGLKPKVSDPIWPEYMQWFHYCEGMVMPPMNTIVVHTILLPEDRRDATVLGQAQRLLTRALEPVEKAIEGREYLVGDFSGCDIMLGHAIFMTDRLGSLPENSPNLKAYVERLKARPAFQKAIAVT